MIIRAPFSRNKDVEGVKQTHESGSSFFSTAQLANYIVYLIQPKGEITETIDAETRVKHLYSSLNIPTPSDFLNQQNYSAIARDIADDYAQRFEEEFIRRLQLYKAHGNTVNNDIPIAQEFIFGFTHNEVKDFENEEAMAEFMISCGIHFSNEYTGFDLGIHEGLIKPHIKRDKNNLNQYLPDMHLLQMPIDVNGKLLTLDKKTMMKKIGQIHYDMEQLPQFQNLEKIRTNAWKNNGKLEKIEVKEDLVSILNDIFDSANYDVKYIEEQLKEQGIGIEIERQGNQAKSFKIRYGNKAFTQDALDIKGKVFNYIKLKTFYEKNPMVSPAHLAKIDAVNKEFVGKPIEELAEALRGIGIALVPNINAKSKKISGYSYAIKSLNGNTVQASVLNFKPANYVITNNSGTKLNIASTIYLNKAQKETQALLGMPEQSINFGGVIYVRDAFGNFKTLKEEIVKRGYVHWSASREETLEDFILRMIASAGNNRASPLLKLLVDDQNKNLLINSYNRTRMLEKLPNGIRCYQAKNRFAVESAVDAFIAQNPLTEEQKADGYVLTMAIETESQEAYDAIWLEAKKKGVFITNGEPSKETTLKYEKLIEQKSKLYRKINLKRIESLKTSIDKKSKYKSLKMQHYKRLGNDVDRKSLRLAFIDAFKLGIDTNYVMNPPRTHKLSTAKLRVDDLQIHYKEMIAIIREEAPEKERDFIIELSKYIDIKVPQKLEIKTDIEKPVIKSTKTQEIQETEKLENNKGGIIKPKQ